MIGQTNMAFFKTMCSRKESKAPLVKVAKYMERLSLYMFNFYHYQWCCPTEWNLIQSHFSPFVAVTHHKLYIKVRLHTFYGETFTNKNILLK